MVIVEPPETTRASDRHLIGGAQHGEGIDARVIAEALVFPGERHAQIARVDFVGLDGQAPLAVARDEGAEQRAVGGGDDDGAIVGARAADRVQAVGDGEREGETDEA